ncbi:SDR family oxidoreductase [Terricaulis sp.]|uniref:SDR family NAD(P)-dependent oxidoreductase n=1 Tax=Terricaulis sp. TaxID=2768686 RepID=UPI002AC6A2D4|nr:SDR family oxidoreductase [Terricaulis sp.]MDZ4690235.1 SDR family oxidoreductase [Terricaulis sp.]
MSRRYPEFEGRCVFITGAASGIGAAFVAAFAAQGARVAFLDTNRDAGEALARQYGARFHECDVTEPAALAATMGRAISELGALDVLINNVANDQRHPADALDPQTWRASLAVNLDPAMEASRVAYEVMRPLRNGVILNLSSINAHLAPANMAAYVAAKAALIGLTKALAREWGAANIRVNAISPGWVVTERQLELWLTPEGEAEWMRQVALQRRISPEDVAKLALFLASDDAALITGQNFIIDGGRT